MAILYRGLVGGNYVYWTSNDATPVGVTETVLITDNEKFPYYYPIDANDVFVWKFNEATHGSYYNSGSAGTYTLTQAISNGVDIPNQIGKISNAVYLSSQSPGCALNASDGNAVGNLGVNTISFGFWIKVLPLAGTETFPIYKPYTNNSTWSDPFASLYVKINAARTIEFGATIGSNGGGTLNTVITQEPTKYAYAYNEWVHLGFAYDSTNGIVDFYRNGVKYTSKTMSATGNIDWNSSQNAGWRVGRVPTAGSEPDFYINDLRVCNVKRPDSWFANLVAATRGNY
jgi:hypothetical protein